MCAVSQCNGRHQELTEVVGVSCVDLSFFCTIEQLSRNRFVFSICQARYRAVRKHNSQKLQQKPLNRILKSCLHFTNYPPT